MPATRRRWVTLTAMGQRGVQIRFLSCRRRVQISPSGPTPALLFRRVAFHFWNREWPEVVRFEEGAARQVHGGNAVVLAYDEQFRSAWYQLKPGMHINANPNDQTNNHPQLVIVTKGAFKAKLDGAERVLAEGESVLIPPGMKHEFWAADDQHGEFIFVAFGKGA